MKTTSFKRIRESNKITALASIATWSNEKVVIVPHSALADCFPDSLPTYAEQKAGIAANPDHCSVYDRKRGDLLFNTAPEPIWEHSMKCTTSDGRVFFWHNTRLTIGGETFPFSDIAPQWLGEEGATYELIDQDAVWEKAGFDRISGFAPGTMLVVEDSKHNGQRVLMASELKFSIAQIAAHLNWLANPYWTVAKWAALKGWEVNGDWGYFDAHKGMRTSIATGKNSTIWIYITE